MAGDARSFASIHGGSDAGGVPLHDGRGVGLPAHGFGDYAHAAQAWGLMPANNADAERPVLSWLCDPSSPLGTAQPMPAMLESQGIVVLDRAYEPLRLSGSPALTAARCDTAWQLWTPNKALGLTGVRAAASFGLPGHARLSVQPPAAQDALENAWRQLQGTAG
jgi:histidinol-phosphate aminotransferase